MQKITTLRLLWLALGTNGLPVPLPSTGSVPQTRHGCSQTQSSSVYQSNRSRSGSTVAAALTVARTDASRCSAPRSAGNLTSRRGATTQRSRGTGRFRLPRAATGPRAAPRPQALAAESRLSWASGTAACAAPSRLPS